MSEVRLCKDCKWCDPRASRDGEDFSKCKRPSGEINLSTGLPALGEWTYCETHRKHGWLTARILISCGAGARWFEPKDKP